MMPGTSLQRLTRSRSRGLMVMMVRPPPLGRRLTHDVSSCESLTAYWTSSAGSGTGDGDGDGAGDAIPPRPEQLQGRCST